MSIVTRSNVELEDICEVICEVITAALAEATELLESVEILSETTYEQLPPSAIQR